MSQTWEAAQTRPRAGFVTGATPFLSRVASGAYPEHVSPNPPGEGVADQESAPSLLPVALQEFPVGGSQCTDLASKQADMGRGGF